MILPVGHNKVNLNYYRLMSDDELLQRHKEAENIWLRLIMSEPYEEFVEQHLETTAFWETNMRNIEAILKERNLNS